MVDRSRWPALSHAASTKPARNARMPPSMWPVQGHGRRPEASPRDVSVPARIVVPSQIANEGEPGRQTRHFRTIHEPPGQDANQTGLLLHIRGGGDILAGLLKRLTME